MEKDVKTTSFKIDKSIWKRARILCIEKNIDISTWIESLIKKELNIE